MPRIRKTLLRLVMPLTSSICDRFNPRLSRSNLISAALARPSSGGAVTATLSAPACSPTIAFFLALGWARTASVAPSACGVTVMDTLAQSLEHCRPDAHQRCPFLNRYLEVAAHSHRQVDQFQSRTCAQVVAQST